MVKQDKVLVQASLPRWFKTFYAIDLPVMLLLFTFVWIQFSRDGFTLSEILGSLFLLIIATLGLWLTPAFLSSITATESGLELHGLWGVRRNFSWNDIVKVSRPRFGIPREFTYVVSKSGEKMILLRSMKGYSELLELIQSRAPNLTLKKLPPELGPRRYTTFWRDALITFGLLVVYFILKRVFHF